MLPAFIAWLDKAVSAVMDGYMDLSGKTSVLRYQIGHSWVILLLVITGAFQYWTHFHVKHSRLAVSTHTPTLNAILMARQLFVKHGAHYSVWIIAFSYFLLASKVEIKYMWSLEKGLLGIGLPEYSCKMSNYHTLMNIHTWKLAQLSRSKIISTEKEQTGKMKLLLN